MELEFVTELPKNARRYGYTRSMVEDFLGSGNKYARIDAGDGRKSDSLYHTFLACVRRNGDLRNRVAVHHLENHVYLERID
jgi:hypothetical protein